MSSCKWRLEYKEMMKNFSRPHLFFAVFSEGKGKYVGLVDMKDFVAYLVTLVRSDQVGKAS